MAAYQELANDDRGSLEVRRALAAAHFYLGNVLLLIGKPEEAEFELRTALSQSEPNLKKNPAINRFLRGVGLHHHFLGLLLNQTGRPTEAAIESRKAIAAFERLVSNDPTDAQSLSVLAYARSQLGKVLLQDGRITDAEAEGRKAFEIHQQLTHDNPALDVFKERLAEELIDLGDAVRAQGRLNEARILYERSISLTRSRVQKESPNFWIVFDLASSIRRHGLTLLRLGDITGAASDARQALALCSELPSRSGYEFETACSHAMLVELAGQPGSGVSAAEGEAHAAQAMRLLELAARMGYRNLSEIRIDSALDPLRSRTDFQLLTRDMAFPLDVFAK